MAKLQWTKDYPGLGPRNAAPDMVTTRGKTEYRIKLSERGYRCYINGKYIGFQIDLAEAEDWLEQINSAIMDSPETDQPYGA